jgi:hypothetical protein
MNGEIPLYITGVFVLTTLLTIGFLLRSFPRARPTASGSQLVTFLLPFWMILTGFLAAGGFYQQFEIFPPRIFTFAVFPSLLTIATLFIFFRRSFVEKLSLRTLTLLHVVRLPVEIVLVLLFQTGLVPKVMTFEGWNFDVLSGLTAPLVAWLAFRNGRTNRPLLIAWNVAALALLANIVIIAILSLPSPMQRLGFEQPNVAVAYIPFVWLPALIVPIVFFSHLAALWNLLRSRETSIGRF